MKNEKIKVRLAGIIPMENGFALMHRVGVQNHPIGEYYVFPGGGQEGNETYEEGVLRDTEKRRQLRQSRI